jgi:hypothetical protein
MVLVLVFAFILGLGALVYFVGNNAKQSARETIAEEQLALTITAKHIATMPSIRTSLAGSTDLTVIDVERARVFAQLVREPVFRSVYRERYAGYAVTIQPIYPPASDYDGLPAPANQPPFEGITLFDFTDAVAAQRNSIPFTVPVLLEDPVTGNTAFGVLTVVQVVP